MAGSRKLASRATPYLLLFLLAAPSALAFDASFPFYPQAAQPCLNASAKTSGCKGDTAAALNVCLCGNGGNFVTLSAQCLGKSDKGDVSTVYDTMSGACSDSGTPLKVSKSDFLNAAAAAGGTSSSTTSTSTTKSTTTSKTSTTTSTSSTKTTTSSPTSSSSAKSSTTSSAPSSPAATTTASSASPTTTPPTGSGNSSNNNNNNTNSNASSANKLSTGATIGVAVGASVAGIAAIAGLALFLIRRRKRKNGGDESHPMLVREKYGSGGSGGGVATTFPPHDPSPSLGGGSFNNSGAKSHYSSSSYGGSGSGVPPPQQQPRLYSELRNTRPGAANPNYEPSYANASAAQGSYVGPYATPQGGAIELPSEERQPAPSRPVFELDSQQSVASPPPVHPLGQEQQQNQQPGYRPYLPQ